MPRVSYTLHAAHTRLELEVYQVGCDLSLCLLKWVHYFDGAGAGMLGSPLEIHCHWPVQVSCVRMRFHHEFAVLPGAEVSCRHRHHENRLQQVEHNLRR
jgi:hypothetical protein